MPLTRSQSRHIESSCPQEFSGIPGSQGIPLLRPASRVPSVAALPLPVPSPSPLIPSSQPTQRVSEPLLAFEKPSQSSILAARTRVRILKWLETTGNAQTVLNNRSGSTQKQDQPPSVRQTEQSTPSFPSRSPSIASSISDRAPSKVFPWKRLLASSPDL